MIGAIRRLTWRWRWWWGLAFTLLASPAYAQSVPRSEALVLFPSQTITATATGAAFNVGWAERLYCVLDLTAVAGGAPSVTAFVQTSIDGAVWDDQFASGALSAAGRNVFSSLATTPANVVQSANHTPTDGTLAAGASRGTPFGNQARVKVVFAGTTTSATLSVTCHGSD